MMFSSLKDRQKSRKRKRRFGEKMMQLMKNMIKDLVESKLKRREKMVDSNYSTVKISMMIPIPTLKGKIERN